MNFKSLKNTIFPGQNFLCNNKFRLFGISKKSKYSCNMDHPEVEIFALHLYTWFYCVEAKLEILILLFNPMKMIKSLRRLFKKFKHRYIGGLGIFPSMICLRVPKITSLHPPSVSEHFLWSTRTSPV